MVASTPTKVTDSAANNGMPADWQPELHEIPIKAIELGSNVRTTPIAGSLDELAASIKARGIVSPVRVAQVGAGKYELIYGQRRVMAAHLAGLSSVPAIVDQGPFDPTGRTVEQLVENLQREDLNPIDTATAYRALLDTGLSQRELGALLGIAQPTIANALRLLKSPNAIQAQIASGELTATHAQAIAKLSDAEQTEIARRIVEHGLSTRQVEDEIRLAAGRQAQADQKRDEYRQMADGAEAALAKKKRGGTKDAATLFSYDDRLKHELRQRGWTVLDERPGYYGAPKGCDCPAWSMSRNYMGDQQDSVTLSAQCIDPEHVKAANDADTEDRAKREVEYRVKAATERKAQRGELAGTAAILASDPLRMERLDLWGSTSGRGAAVAEWLAEELSVTTPEELWAKIEQLDAVQVVTWRARVLADWLLHSFPADDPMRVAFTTHADEPKPKKAPKVKA